MPEPVTSILVVDDNEAERYYLTRILGKAGFRVLEAATGLDGLRIAESDRPELITLDIRLPDINGFEVCRRLKSNPATRDTPVVHISASFTTPEAKAEGLDGGADGYLTHPVDPNELLATLRALLRARRAESQVRAAAREWTTTFDLISDPVCLTGAADRIVRCNQAFARLVGLPFAEVIGQRVQELIPPLARTGPGQPSGSHRYPARRPPLQGQRRPRRGRARARHPRLGPGRRHRAPAAGGGDSPERGRGPGPAAGDRGGVHLGAGRPVRVRRGAALRPRQPADGRHDRAPGGTAPRTDPSRVRARAGRGAGAPAPRGAGHGRAGLQRRDPRGHRGAAGRRARLGRRPGCRSGAPTGGPRASTSPRRRSPSAAGCRKS